MAHGAHGQRDRQQHRLVGLADETAEGGRDVDVGGGEHPGGVELGEQPAGGQREVAVVQVDRVEGVGHRTTTPSSRSDSSSTSATGGRHENTPHGAPSTTGVSGPHMPRR